MLELIRGRVSSSPIGDTRLNSLVCWSHRYFDATDGSALDMEAADCPWAVMADWAVAPDDPVLSVIPGLLLRSHIKWWHNCRCAQNCGRQVFSTSWGFDSLVLRGRVRVRLCVCVCVCVFRTRSQVLHTTSCHGRSWLRSLPYSSVGRSLRAITSGRCACVCLRLSGLVHLSAVFWVSNIRKWWSCRLYWKITALSIRYLSFPSQLFWMPAPEPF